MSKAERCDAQTVYDALGNRVATKIYDMTGLARRERVIILFMGRRR